MDDLETRLLKPVMVHSNAEQTNAERREASAELTRLRAEVERLTNLIPVASKEGQDKIDQAIAPYRKFISETPELTSLLYDIDLLPEQIRLPQNANRMIAVCELYKARAALAAGGNGE